ncbi:MAG: molybdate ABC transporter substrate-binding protein [Marinobacter sp.]|uniref:molybdate ABC transporter substrate-binding protein n=1 Tax=Marinobacter sp. TaxID=50741 RepID=UPI001B5C9E11|nr:molybdate ABC transporter substrate-binding protein [Marinobacter sp.]MBQ0745105.1 molybdate ABC transporter substrate-binding protein [Marinobacter sp.]MBQ0813259.1 molybdate ABC transporter substrate-binding protein [Marinobacter sp.]
MHVPGKHHHPVAGLCLLLALSSMAHAADVRLAVAANFTDTARDLIAAFGEATGLETVASYGSTGKLYAQIEHGAPFDVFLAADSRRPELLEENGQGVGGTRFTYAKGKLALWSSVPGTFEDPKAWLESGGFARLAIANPKTAPYGLAAQQVLSELGVWESLQSRLVRGDSIAQTFQFVATTNAQSGFVALSQVRAWDEKGGSLWLIPQAYYSPIKQQAILLTRSETKNAAHQWLEFLRGDEARGIIEESGYETEH